jgi:hypothetical protein
MLRLVGSKGGRGEDERKHTGEISRAHGGEYEENFLLGFRLGNLRDINSAANSSEKHCN